MRESYTEGVATHGVPESCADFRKGADEARKMHASHVDRMAAKGLTPGVSDADVVAWWENELLGG